MHLACDETVVIVRRRTERPRSIMFNRKFYGDVRVSRDTPPIKYERRREAEKSVVAALTGHSLPVYTPDICRHQPRRRQLRIPKLGIGITVRVEYRY